jgi:hypothetical protein
MRKSRIVSIGMALILTMLASVASAAATYPASCLADGLPLGQANKDPHWQSLPISLHGDFNSCFINPAAPTYKQAQAECVYSEDVAVTVWRVPCSGAKSATLLELDRSSALNGNTNLYPTFPGIWVKQDTKIAYIRLAADANTTASQVFVNSPVTRSSVYVLENFAGTTTFDFNLPYTLTVDNNTGLALQFDLLTYDAADYAQGNLPISGYMTGSWYLPSNGGEGMLTQVLDNPDGVSRTFVATWYTFDALGQPFWMIAQGVFPIGATQISKVSVNYVVGGGFAGNFTSVKSTPWGTMSFAFPDCNTLTFSYASTATSVTSAASADASSAPLQPADAPIGSGTRTWSRIGTINHLTCD